MPVSRVAQAVSWAFHLPNEQVRGVFRLLLSQTRIRPAKGSRLRPDTLRSGGCAKMRLVDLIIPRSSVRAHPPSFSCTKQPAASARRRRWPSAVTSRWPPTWNSPSLARLGIGLLVPDSTMSSLPSPAGAQVAAFATSPRGLRNVGDELSELPAAFEQPRRCRRPVASRWQWSAPPGRCTTRRAGPPRRIGSLPCRPTAAIASSTPLTVECSTTSRPRSPRRPPSPR